MVLAARTPCRRAGSSSWQAGSTRGNRRMRRSRCGYAGRYPSGRHIGRDFHQVAIGIAAVHRLHGSQRTGAFSRACQDGDAAVVQVRDHLIRWRRGDEAEVGGAGSVVVAGDPGARIGAARAHVDLLPAELQRGAVVRAEVLALHAEYALIPGGGDLHVLHVQHDVVDAVDGEAHVIRSLQAMSLSMSLSMSLRGASATEQSPSRSARTGLVEFASSLTLLAITWRAADRAWTSAPTPARRRNRCPCRRSR